TNIPRDIFPAPSGRLPRDRFPRATARSWSIAPMNSASPRSGWVSGSEEKVIETSAFSSRDTTLGGMREAPLSRSDRAIQTVLGLAFLAAGVLKILDPLAFAISIARLRLLPASTAGELAIVLPWLEVVTAVALFLPKY